MAAEVKVPLQTSMSDARCAQADAPAFLPASNAGGKLTDICTIPLMQASCFVGGDAPKGTLDKIELMLASIPAADQGAC